MATIVLQLPRMHGGQRTVARQSARFNVLACGRRWGKTIFGIDRLLEPALSGYPTAWFAPTYKYLTEVWRDLIRILKPVIRRGGLSRQEKRIELITGGSIECWSLTDKDSGRSRKYKRVVVDEAAKVKSLEEIWTKAIRPTLTDMIGDAYILSTPKGRNYFWQMFTKGQDDRKCEWKSWQQSSMVNPYISKDELDEIKRDSPERVWRQEFLAEFIEEGTGVFRNILDAVDAGRYEPDPAEIGMFYSTGADLARVNDFTVLSTLDAYSRQVNFERFQQVAWKRQLNAIKSVSERYPGTVQLDSTGLGNPIPEWLETEGVSVEPYHFTHSSKMALIENLGIGIENGRLRLMDIPAQTNELLAYEYDTTPSGKVTCNAPEGMNDDTVVALALAYWGVGSGAPAATAQPPARVPPVPTSQSAVYRGNPR